MRVLRIIYGVFKVGSMMYSLYKGTRATRVIWFLVYLWRLFRKKPNLLRKPRVVYTFIGAGDERIYRRQGWTKIASRRKNDGHLG